MSNRIRCAIYTRKSTEDGLEQSFNSLHAQREACEAYVKSQCGMSWVALPTDYDDGGLSGGTLERPALQRLLADIAARKVDLVVVYKVDRLTRSLSDFAKIVEVFDASGVSFVSVTQQFNTTTSMGRLTLNMLLSFAQFEREVTGERIRDKIAASKKKGMWTGGPVPLGYDVQDKQLSINVEEAETVRALFRLYLECSTVQELIDRARDAGLITKQRRFSDGRVAGGRSFTRGHLYQLLSNPLYVGEVAHREVRHRGRHQAIVDHALFDAVQRRLNANRVRRQAQKNAEAPSLLTGLVFDEAGERLSPTHANKGGRRYPYYTSQRLIHRADPSAQGWRLPARELEQAVIDPLATFLRDAGRLMEALPAGATPDQLRQMLDRARSAAGTLESDHAEQRPLLMRLVSRVIVSATSLCLEVPRQGLLEVVFPDTALQPTVGESFTLTTGFQVKRRGRQARLVIGEARTTRRPDPTLIALVAKAHWWFDQLATGAAASIRELAARASVHPSDIGRVLPLAFLAPDIVEAILTGAQPTELTAWRLKRLRTLPMAWESQRQVLGF